MNEPRWIIAISPDGAARAVAEKTAAAFREILGADRCRSFDTRAFRDGYKKLLKEPADDMVADLLNQSFVVSCFDFKATHCLVCALCPVTLFTLNILRKHGIVTVHWFYEDFRRASYWREVLPGCDHFCAIQRGPLPHACSVSNAAFHLVPTAGLTDGLLRGVDERTFDVAFVGIPSPYRIAVLEALASIGLAVACGGEGWGSYRGVLQKNIIAARWMSGEETAGLLGRTKIGINLSFSEPHEREHIHISPRAYDILSSGALLLTEESPLVTESLAGCSFQAFGSPEEALAACRDLVRRYASLMHEIEKNRQSVLDRHTFLHRARDIISCVN